MYTTDIEKLEACITVEIIEYVPNTVIVKTVLKKSSENISFESEDAAEGLTEKISPFDTFVQVIDGRIELVINGKLNPMQTGQSMIIPAFAPNYVKPGGRFKMLLTVIKNEYE